MRLLDFTQIHGVIVFVARTEIQTVCGRSKGGQLEEVLKRGMSQYRCP